MITVGFVHHSLQLGGGSERVVHDIAANLDRLRFRPVLYCMYELGDHGRQLADGGVAVRDRIFERPLDVRGLLRLRDLMKDDEVDIVYVTDGFANMIVAALAGRWASVPVKALAFHSYDTVLRRRSKPARRRMLELTDRLIHPLFERYVALAPSHRRYLADTKGLPPNRIDFVFNGVRETALRSQVHRVDPLAGHGVPPGAPIAVMVAGLRPWKRQDVFIAAAELVAKSVPDAHFLLVGDGSERSRLEALVSESGVRDRVHFLGRIDNVPAVLNRSDVSVLSSEHEALPLVLLESMVFELPVVATDVGSVADIVVNGETGVLVGPGDIEAMATAITAILTDSEKAHRMGRAGKSRVDDVFSLEKTLSRYEELFTAWLSDRSE